MDVRQFKILFLLLLLSFFIKPEQDNSRYEGLTFVYNCDWLKKSNKDFGPSEIYQASIVPVNDHILMINDPSRLSRLQNNIVKSKKQQRREARDVKNRQDEVEKNERVNFYNQTKATFTDSVLWQKCLIDKPVDLEFQNFINNLLLKNADNDQGVFLPFEDIKDKVVKNYNLPEQTQQLLRDNFAEPSEFEKLDGHQEQQALMQKLVDILNQASQLKISYYQARPVNNISNLIAKVSKYSLIGIKNNDKNSSILYIKFCGKLLEVEKCYLNLLKRGFEIDSSHPKDGLLPEFFEPLSEAIYEYVWEQGYKCSIEESCKYGGGEYFKRKIRDKYLTDNYFKACDEAKEILSDLLLLNCENLDQFKRDFVEQGKDPETMYSEDYCGKAKLNVAIVARYLTLNDKRLVDLMSLDASKEMEFAKRCLPSFNIYKILAPIKDIFHEAGTIAKSKVDREIIRRNVEIEKEREAYSKINDWHENEILKQQQNLELEKNYKSNIDLPKITSDFDEIIKSSKSEYECKVAKCGLDFVKNLEEALEDEDFVEVSCNEKRLSIAKELIIDSDARIKTEQIFKLSDNAKRELINSNENLSDYEEFNGNKLQHQLHKEIVDTLNESSDLLAAFSDKKPIMGINRFIHCSSNLAIECNKSEEIQRGFALEDLSKSFLDLGKQIVDYSYIIGDGIYRGTCAAGKGCAKGVWNSACFAGNTVRHPIITSKETVETLGKILYWAGYLTCYKIPTCFYKGCELAYIDQDEFINQTCKYASALKELTKSGLIYGWNNSEKVIEKTTEMLTTFLCGNKIPTFQGVLFKNLKCLSTCLVEEIKFAKALKQTQNLNIAQLPNLSLKSLNSPVKQVFKNFFAINQIKKEHGKEVLDVVLKLVKEEPAILQGRGLQKLLKPKTSVIENLNYRRVSPKDDFYAATTWVDQQYAKIRECLNDVNQIAKNTNFTKQSIQKIKDHLFYKKHILNDGRIDFFDADVEIASAWDRLIKGDFIKNDIQLLKHEVLESYLENKLNLNSSQAHDKVKMFFDWHFPGL